MECPRCFEKMENVVEYFEQEPKFIYTKDFYCSKCKSVIIEQFDEQGLSSSEWIDFNV